MAKYQHFEGLPVWQEAKRLYNVVLDLLEDHGVPLTPAFRNQLDRAALSVQSFRTDNPTIFRCTQNVRATNLHGVEKHVDPFLHAAPCGSISAHLLSANVGNVSKIPFPGMTR